MTPEKPPVDPVAEIAKVIREAHVDYATPSARHEAQLVVDAILDGKMLRAALLRAALLAVGPNRMVLVRHSDLDTLMYAFDTPGAPTLGARPSKRLRAVLASTPDNPPSEPLEERTASAGTPGHPDPAQATQERRERYADALRVGPGENLAVDRAMAVADAELAATKDHADTLQEIVTGRGYALTDARDEANRLLTDLRRSLQETWVAENARDEANAEADRLRAEVTFERLAAETGTEKVAAEWKHQVEVLNCWACVVQAERDKAMANGTRWERCYLDVCAQRDEARATIERVKGLLPIADHGPQCAVWNLPVRGTWNACTCTLAKIRAALDAPTEPSPIPPEEIAEWDGYGRHLAADVGVTVHDPSKAAHQVTLAAHDMPPGSVCGPCARGLHLFNWPPAPWSQVDGCPCCETHRLSPPNLSDRLADSKARIQAAADRMTP